MSNSDSINRRQFLEKSSLVAAAATAVGVRPATAQVNNSAAVNL
jgi:nitrous oxide reductase